MPERCPEENAKCRSFRIVRLYIVDRQQRWLHEEDVTWAVRYMFAQQQLKGFPSVPGGKV